MLTASPPTSPYEILWKSFGVAEPTASLSREEVYKPEFTLRDKVGFSFVAAC